jgi:glycosyltransferase involved in cell wall biosynthesis
MQQTVRDIEIILVDSGSTDATLSIANRYPVRVVYLSPDEFSFGRSLNVGCQAARGKYLVFASAHVYPLYNDWLEQLIAPFKDPKVALAYGRQLGGDCTKFSEHQVFAKWFPGEANLKQKHTFCNNANASIRQELWEQIPYDEELTGLEDLDWAKKAIAQGYHLAYVAGAEIVHLHNETPARIYNRYRREAIALKKIFPEEKFTLWDFSLLFMGNVASDSYHAIISQSVLDNFKSILVFRFMQFWGVYRGFSQKDPVTSILKRTFYYPNGRSDTPNAGFKVDNKRQIDYSMLLNERSKDGDN